MIDAKKMPKDIFSPLTVSIISEEKALSEKSSDTSGMLVQVISDIAYAAKIRSIVGYTYLRSSEYSPGKYRRVKEAIQTANITILNDIKETDVIKDLLNRISPGSVRLDKKFIVISAKMNLKFAQTVSHAGADFCMSSADITAKNLEEVLANLIDSITLQAQFIGK